MILVAVRSLVAADMLDFAATGAVLAVFALGKVAVDMFAAVDKVATVAAVDKCAVDDRVAVVFDSFAGFVGIVADVFVGIVLAMVRLPVDKADTLVAAVAAVDMVAAVEFDTATLPG